MIIFVSNYYNHHQSALSEAIYQYTFGEYRFIETEPMSNERIQLGWGGENAIYVTNYYDNKEKHQEEIDKADVVICGSAPQELLKKRLSEKRLTFLYSERPYKEACPWYKIPIHIWRYHQIWGKQKNHYLLCASAFASYDYSKVRRFVGKSYCWGYFPEVVRYNDFDKVMKQKSSNTILWVGRFVKSKHPELSILVASRLKNQGYKVKMTLIGMGEMKQELQKMILDLGLQDCVQILSSMPPSEVRKHMEQSAIFMFTSDRNEGWGAVLNESMNSGCAVVASHEIGSVPFLIENGKNGLIYRDGDFESLYSAVKQLLDYPEIGESLGKEAYRTMTSLWNAETAAKRLLLLIEDIKRLGKSNRFATGPCSRASVLKDDWF